MALTLRIRRIKQVVSVLTVVFDLVAAIEVGILLAAVLFMKRMSEVTEVEGWKYVEEEDFLMFAAVLAIAPVAGIPPNSAEAGIAVTIAIGQIKDFLGITYPEGTVTIETMEKAGAVIKNIATINLQAVIVGLVCLAILIVFS